MYHGYVPGVISLQVIRDGLRQVTLVPLSLRTGTAAHVFFYLRSSIETFVILLTVACVVTTG